MSARPTAPVTFSPRAGTKVLPPLLIAALASGPVALVLFWLASLSPSTVEAWYSRGVYAAVQPFWSRLTGAVPFSLAEVLLPLAVLAGLALFFFTPKAWLYNLAGVSVLVAWFVFGWGLNYQRQPWAASNGLEVRGGTMAELTVLAEALVARANLTRPEAPASWKALVPPAKGALSSPLLSWLGIAGIYLPWFSEPLVNTGPPAWQLPFTAAHEAAHQQGWAREDEANFLAWKTLQDHPESAAQYAAALGALPYVAGALVSVGPEGVLAWQKVSASLEPAVKADWQANQQWWQAYQGPVQRVAQAVNDTYLKSQGQSDGVRSYGRMVDLLLAWETAAATGKTPSVPPGPAP